MDHIRSKSQFLTVCANLWQIFYFSFNGCEWFLIFFNKIPFLRSMYLHYKSKRTSVNKQMRNLAAVNSHDSTILILLRSWAMTDKICSAMQSMISRCVILFFSLFITFRTNVRMSIIPLVFHFTLWFKLSIFFSLVLLSVSTHKRRGKKLTEKNINVDWQFFKNVICIFWCYSV